MKVFHGVLALALASLTFAAEPSRLGSAEEATKWAERTLAKMPLEKKVAQIVFIDIAGGYLSADDPRLKSWIRMIHDFGVGGAVSYGGTPRDVAALLNRLQREAEIPLLFSSDFEGGPGQQVSGATEFPGNMAFAAIGSEDLVYRAASIGAAEGRAMGFGLTYSPVVDLTTQPENPAESVRSFGSDVDLLGRLAGAYIRGYMDGGMLATAKHFPGRGATSKWPATPAYSSNQKTADAVEHEDLAAFKKAIDAGVPMIMTEHVIVPSLTGGSDLPASVEPKLATDWLRNRLGFRGLLTTDDLWYDHVIDRFGPVGVGIKALQAGHDLLLKPKDAAAMIEGVVQAVKRGEVKEEHIDQAVRKLLYWKARLHLNDNRFVDESKVAVTVGTPAHWAFAQQIADRSLTVLKNDGVLPLSAGPPKKMVNISIQKLPNDPSPDELALKLQTAFPGMASFTLRPDTDSSTYSKALDAAKAADFAIVSLFVQRDKMGDATPLRAADIDLVTRLSAAKPGKMVAMSYGNPHLIRKLEQVPAFVVGYGERSWFGNQPIYFDSFIRLLKGEIKPEGRLPIVVSAKYPFGTGIRW